MKMMTVDEFARSRGISKSTVWRLLKNNQIAYENFAPAGSSRRIPRICEDTRILQKVNVPMDNPG